MKNIFGLFGNQNTNEENTAIDLNEQELEAVNGGHGDDYCYEDEDDYCYDDDDEHRHHHRHHHHRDY